MRPAAILVAAVLLAGPAAAQRIEVPDLVGMTEADARAALSDAGLSGKVHAKTSSGPECTDRSQAEGDVCAQKPAAGATHPAILDVFVVVQGKRRARKLQSPGFRASTTVDQAREMLLQKGFTGPVEVLDSSEPGAKCQYPDREVGALCGHDPRGGRSVPEDVAWTFVVQGERGSWDAYGIPPKVLGLPVLEALAKLTEQNFQRLSVGFSEDDDCRPMVVCDMGAGIGAGGYRFDKLVSRATADIRLKVGSQYPESEPEGAVWPEVVGDTLEVALTKADASGLNTADGSPDWIGVRYRDVADTKLPDGQMPEPGVVVAQSAQPGWDLRRRQELTVAERREEGAKDGKRWKRMPALLGMDVDDAVDILDDLGMKKVQVKPKRSDPDCVPSIVCGSSPNPDEKAFLEATQLLYVGAEPAPGDALPGRTDDPPADDSEPSGTDDWEPGGDDSGDEEPLDDELPDDYEPLFGR